MNGNPYSIRTWLIRCAVPRLDGSRGIRPRSMPSLTVRPKLTDNSCLGLITINHNYFYSYMGCRASESSCTSRASKCSEREMRAPPRRDGRVMVEVVIPVGTNESEVAWLRRIKATERAFLEDFEGVPPRQETAEGDRPGPRGSDSCGSPVDRYIVVKYEWTAKSRISRVRTRG
jgi:hypothetical protein